MKEETVKRFLNKNVKLVTEGYALHGRIREIQNDCIIFETQKAISAINLKAIDKIVCQCK